MAPLFIFYNTSFQLREKNNRLGNKKLPCIISQVFVSELHRCIQKTCRGRSESFFLGGHKNFFPRFGAGEKRKKFVRRKKKKFLFSEKKNVKKKKKEN